MGKEACITLIGALLLFAQDHNQSGSDSISQHMSVGAHVLPRTGSPFSAEIVKVRLAGSTAQPIPNEQVRTLQRFA